MFFASNAKGKVIAVFKTNRTAAIAAAHMLQAYVLEDRKTGEVWGSREFIALQMAAD